MTELRRELGKLQAYAAMIGILVGAGIFKVTGDASALTGASVVLGFAVLAPVVLIAAVPYAVFHSTPLAEQAGGDYGHIRAVFGRGLVAFTAGWLKLISYLGALAFLSRVLADYLLEAAAMVGLPAPGGPHDGWQLGLASAALVGFYAIHSRGVGSFGRVQLWMFALLALSLVVLVVPGLAAIELDNYRPFFAGGAMGFARSLPPLFFAYAGFEALAHHSAEARDARALPRIYLRGVLWTTAIFVSMSAVAFGVLDAGALAQSQTPMAAAAQTFLPAGGALVVACGGVLAAATSVNATLAVPARLMLSLTSDGFLPARCGRLDDGTPRAGLRLTLAIALLLLWSGQTGLMLGIAVMSLVGVYALHCTALLAAGRRAPRLWRAAAERGWRWRTVAPLAAAGAVLLTAMLATVVAGDVAAVLDADLLTRWRAQALTGSELLLVWAAAGGVVYALRRR